MLTWYVPTHPAPHKNMIYLLTCIFYFGIHINFCIKYVRIIFKDCHCTEKKITISYKEICTILWKISRVLIKMLMKKITVHYSPILNCCVFNQKSYKSLNFVSKVCKFSSRWLKSGLENNGINNVKYIVLTFY